MRTVTEAADRSAEAPLRGDDTMTITDVLDRMVERAGEGRVSIGDMLDAFGRRGFGPLILILGLISLSPIGSIPGMSITTGTLVILLCVQMLMKRPHPWVPGRLERLDMDSRQARAGLCRVRPYVRKIERVVKPRWQRLLRPPFTDAVALVCIVMAVLMYPLALVPWGVAAPSLALAALGLGMTSRDGVLTAIGLTVAGGALGFGISLVVMM